MAVTHKDDSPVLLVRCTGGQAPAETAAAPAPAEAQVHGQCGNASVTGMLGWMVTISLCTDGFGCRIVGIRIMINVQ